jgi:hypothetical protein
LSRADARARARRALLVLNVASSLLAHALGGGSLVRKVGGLLERYQKQVRVVRWYVASELLTQVGCQASCDASNLSDDP